VNAGGPGTCWARSFISPPDERGSGLMACAEVSGGVACMVAELVARGVRIRWVTETNKAKARRELVSFNTRRIVALVVMVLGSIFGGLLAVAFTDSRLAAIVGVILGAVAGVVFILIWANRSLWQTGPDAGELFGASRTPGEWS
jgi:F0F1-type ATP synthase assembly protein I